MTPLLIVAPSALAIIALIGYQYYQYRKAILLTQIGIETGGTITRVNVQSSSRGDSFNAEVTFQVFGQTIVAKDLVYTVKKLYQEGQPVQLLYHPDDYQKIWIKQQNPSILLKSAAVMGIAGALFMSIMYYYLATQLS